MREFIRTTDEQVYFLDTPEAVALAQQALRDAGVVRSKIWITSTDESSEDVYTHGQYLTAKTVLRSSDDDSGNGS